MPQNTMGTYFLQHVFTDVDDLAVSARQWNLDVRQLERGKFHGNVLQFGVSGVHVADARFCRSLNQKGMPPAGLRTIAVPANPNLRVEWRGKLIDGQSLMVFPRGAELSSVSGPDFHVFTCSFPEELLSVASETLELGDIDQLRGGVEAIHVESPAITRLRNALRRISLSVRNDQTELSNPALISKLTCDLPSLVIKAVARGRGKCPPATGAKRLAALTRAEAFIEQHAREDIRVGDICQAAGVSERTLEYAFVERFGIGPKEFLNAFRLSSAYRELRAGNSRTTKVADVANAWGFWHFGQFAADYRKRFEELPSKTLRRESPGC